MQRIFKGSVWIFLVFLVVLGVLDVQLLLQTLCSSFRLSPIVTGVMVLNCVQMGVYEVWSRRSQKKIRTALAERQSEEAQLSKNWLLFAVFAGQSARKYRIPLLEVRGKWEFPLASLPCGKQRR